MHAELMAIRRETAALESPSLVRQCLEATRGDTHRGSADPGTPVQRVANDTAHNTVAVRPLRRCGRRVGRSECRSEYAQRARRAKKGQMPS